MLDRHEPQDSGNGAKPHRDVATDAAQADRRMADREVPLPGTPGTSSLAVHEWLDGDLSEADARRADARQVEFWTRMASETDRRRRMTTPAHVLGNVMAALPDREVALPGTNAAARSRDGRLRPSSAVAIGAGFFTLGVVVGRLFGR
jgi:hypothetical protein